MDLIFICEKKPPAIKVTIRLERCQKVYYTPQEFRHKN